MDILFFIVGLVLIMVGANFMTEGASSVAKRLGMSDFVVGLTVVSMMTSAPELVVSLTGAISGAAPMAVGNIVGSNIFNILAIVGIVAMIKPVKVGEGVLLNEIPFVILSSVALLAIGCAPWFDAAPLMVTRVEGILLLLFFLIFMRYTFTVAKSEKLEDDPTVVQGARSKKIPLWLSLIYLFGGLGALIWGGELFVNGASGIAVSSGMSEALTGLTIVAAGTSLPELATSVVAAVKGFPGMCIGNVIGSCIFNIFFVLATTSIVFPLTFGNIGLFDLLVLTGASVLFWGLARFGGVRTIKRGEGLILFLFYIGYMTAICLMV